MRSQSLPINATDFIPLTLHTRASERVHYRYARINIMCTPRIIIVYIYTYKFFTTVSPPSPSHRLQPVKFVFAQMHALLLRATPYTSTAPPTKHASPFQNIFCVGWHEGVWSLLPGCVLHRLHPRPRTYILYPPTPKADTVGDGGRMGRHRYKSIMKNFTRADLWLSVPRNEQSYIIQIYIYIFIYSCSQREL